LTHLIVVAAEALAALEAFEGFACTTGSTASATDFLTLSTTAEGHGHLRLGPRLLGANSCSIGGAGCGHHLRRHGLREFGLHVG